MGPAEPIPLTVLTGFLGAGKTSLLNRLIADPALADTAVIINEFGEIGLDHLLVEPIKDGVVLLQSGCLCCTLRGDLVDALEQLLRDLDNGRVTFRRVMLETTGLADPAPVLQTAMAHPYLVMRYRLDGVVTVVDAVNGAATLDEHLEVGQAGRGRRPARADQDRPHRHAGAPRRQGAARGPPARAQSGGPDPRRRRRRSDAARLLDCGLFDPDRKIPDVKRWLAAEAYAEQAPHGHHQHGEHHHDVNRHDERIRAFSFAADAAIPAAMFEMFLDLLRSLHGPNLLRLKGIVKLAETPESPLVIHGVQHVFHPPVRLPRWPDGDQRTRIVLITRDLEPSAVSACSTPSWAPAPPTSRTAPLARQPAGAVRGRRSVTGSADRSRPCHLPPDVPDASRKRAR